MGDWAPVHITIGGNLPRHALEELAMRAADYDLRIAWDDEPFDPTAINGEEPLELYGTELNGGLIPDIEELCVDHGLVFRRWSGGCYDVFSPEIIICDAEGSMHFYLASDDEEIVFSSGEIKGFTRLRDLKSAIARAEITIPPLVLV